MNTHEGQPAPKPETDSYAQRVAGFLRATGQCLRDRVAPDFSGFGDLPDPGVILGATPYRANDVTEYDRAPEPPAPFVPEL